MLYVLGILFGICVGFALGLTGGGGSIFAVPLLVYAMSVPAHEAVGISLAAVGATAAVGMIQRLRRKEVEVRTGLLFAVTGMCGAPLGAWFNSLIPATWLLILFAVLMLLIAIRMWLKATKKPADAGVVRASVEPIPEDSPGPTCRRDPQGKLRMTSHCAGLLAVLGLLTGVLSGLFGVGGGFVIVPALVLFSGMGIHRAVATSLLVITLVSASGLTSYFDCQSSDRLWVGWTICHGRRTRNVVWLRLWPPRLGLFPAKRLFVGNRGGGIVCRNQDIHLRSKTK